MFKKNTSIFIIIMFMFTLLPSTFFQKVHAYTSNSYFNNLKVGLTSMSTTSIKITLNGDYTLNGQTYPSGSVLNLAINGTSIIFNSTSLTEINLVPNSQSNLLTITSGTVTNKYMGSFLMKVNNAKILPINTIDMENYLKGVVGYEMSDYFPIEALKAQAVAARNYALSKIGYEAAKGYDFDDTIYYQVYKGYNASYTRVMTAVEETKGQVLLYNDRLVETLYSAWHGGVSENSENVWGNTVPYLRSVQDTYENDPWPGGNRILTNTQIQNTLKVKGYLSATDTFINLDLNSITNFASGRVSNINIIYKNALGVLLTRSVARDNTRTFLSLPSNLYTVSYDSISGAYTFSGRGYGHGLGMSQIGAKNRAIAGQTYDEILKFYYQNTYLQTLILKASLSTLTQNTNALNVGDTISLTSTATGGNGYGYLFKYVIKNGSDTILTKEYSSNSILDFVPTIAGNYTLEAYVKDKFSIADYDDKKESSFTVYESSNIFDPLTFTSFTKDLENVFEGDIVNFSTTVVGGSNKETTYKFQVIKDGQEVLTRDYDTNSSLQYVPALSGNYEVNVFAKDILSEMEYDDVINLSFTVFSNAKISSFKANKAEYLAGDIMNLNTTATLGSGSYLYKHVISKNGVILSTIDYTSSESLQYIVNTSGTYSITVYLKDVLSNNEFDAQNTLNINVYSPELSTITATGSFYEGKPLTLNGSSIGSSPLGFSYKYEVYQNATLVTTNNFNNSSAFTFTATVPGIYTVKVYGKDGLSSKTYDSMKQFSITINNKPLYLSTLPLKYGMTSNDVASLQSTMAKLGYRISDKSGYFGTRTKNQVISFQKSKGLPKDGIVGSLTYNALNEALIQKSGVKTLTY